MKNPPEIPEEPRVEGSLGQAPRFSVEATGNPEGESPPINRRLLQ
jgi:hypothetical protein